MDWSEVADIWEAMLWRSLNLLMPRATFISGNGGPLFMESFTRPARSSRHHYCCYNRPMDASPPCAISDLRVATLDGHTANALSPLRYCVFPAAELLPQDQGTDRLGPHNCQSLPMKGRSYSRRADDPLQFQIYGHGYFTYASA